jgi:hypothetical protein
MLSPKYSVDFVLLHIYILFLYCTYTIHTYIHTHTHTPLLVYISLTLPVNYNSQLHIFLLKTTLEIQSWKFVSELSYYGPFMGECLLFAISTIISSEKWRNQLMNRKSLSIYCLTKCWHINVLILAPSSPMEIFKLGISAYTRLN